MVDDVIGRDIMSLGIQVLVIGDPAQLPPVKNAGRAGYFMRNRPTALLTEIQRHGGIILDLAQDVRKNGVEVLTDKRYEAIVHRSLGASMALGYDQIIVGRNITRDRKNETIRNLFESEDDAWVAPEERIIMLETNYKYNVLNSQQFYVDECEPIVHEHQQVRMRLTCECLPSGASLCPYCGWLSRSEAMVWSDGFTGCKEAENMDPQPRWRALWATYGYAITAQGSEWDSVLVVDENHVFRKWSVNWLYTAITRARKELTIIRTGTGPRRQHAREEERHA